MTIYCCPKCSYFSASRGPALKHLRQHGGAKKKLIEIDTKKFKSVEFFCRTCETSRPSFKGLLTHLRAHGYTRPRNVHYCVKLTTEQGKVTWLKHETATVFSRTKRGKKSKTPVDVPVDVSKAANKINKVEVSHNHALIRVPVILVIDLAAGTNTIEPMDAHSLVDMM